MPRKAAKKPQPPKLPKGEAEQVRIRREIGHDFALKPDGFGRQRLATGTAEARRIYEVSNGGYTSTGRRRAPAQCRSAHRHHLADAPAARGRPTFS
ncbi:hypothetical protein [Mesorhizobium sp. B1-1-5]|uniref:hypothetical protein n=1 Tax=Mesorhizobium sp. B1-1-5 TaxID=2589979 RepID=UPI001FEF6132|nr:hypothetical protein [Mesorhizobium sp. B1-1-5]